MSNKSLNNLDVQASNEDGTYCQKLNESENYNNSPDCDIINQITPGNTKASVIKKKAG